MPDNVVQLVFWVDEGESKDGHQYPKFILEKGDCDLASFIESIRKDEIIPNKD
jgi:hypothetical protein